MCVVCVCIVVYMLIALCRVLNLKVCKKIEKLGIFNKIKISNKLIHLYIKIFV